MLSYRHSFHAGNFADVLKHFCLYHTLNYLNRKNSPYLYMDTHAGAGLYDLNNPTTQKNKEYLNGIARLLKEEHRLSPSIAKFINQFKTWLPDSMYYPGSPWIAAQMLRENDTLYCCELHTTDIQLLRQHLLTLRPKHTIIQYGNGFHKLLGLLPPPQRRVVIFIDPSYEDKSDYPQVLLILTQAISLFSQGTYLVWYPLLPQELSQSFPTKLIELAKTHGNYIHIHLQTTFPNNSGYGMYGCGILILNPPYIFPKIFADSKQILSELLGDDRMPANIQTISHIP